MSQIIPLTTQPDQSLTVTGTIDGSPLTLSFRVLFSEMAGYWVLTINDTSGNLILDSLPMITGLYPAANILGQFAYLAIGSLFVINVSGAVMDYPDDTNLGSA